MTTVKRCQGLCPPFFFSFLSQEKWSAYTLEHHCMLVNPDNQHSKSEDRAVSIVLYIVITTCSQNLSYELLHLRDQAQRFKYRLKFLNVLNVKQGNCWCYTKKPFPQTSMRWLQGHFYYAAIQFAMSLTGNRHKGDIRRQGKLTSPNFRKGRKFLHKLNLNLIDKIDRILPVPHLLFFHFFSFLPDGTSSSNSGAAGSERTSFGFLTPFGFFAFFLVGTSVTSEAVAVWGSASAADGTFASSMVAGTIELSDRFLFFFLEGVAPSITGAVSTASTNSSAGWPLRTFFFSQCVVPPRLQLSSPP